MSDVLENETMEKRQIRIEKREAERARRKEERIKLVRRQKIIMTVVGAAVCISVLVIIVWCLSPVRLMMSLARAEKYVEKADYAAAENSYGKALELNDTSVQAYRGMTDVLAAQERISEAENIVYTGWEKTQDENLLHYYCTLVLNEAVAQINDKNCSLDTVNKCVQVLELDADNEDALYLMNTCYERLFKVTENETTCMLFFDPDAEEDTCDYTEYEQLLHRILAVYQTNPSEELKKIMIQYTVIDMPEVRISMPHVAQYESVLKEISSVLPDDRITETLACLAKAQETEDYFAKAFEEFEKGNYAYARELIAEESYQQIRDQFINEDSGYWKGSVYIPVSREQMVLNNEDGKITFSFLGSKDYDASRGIITVWGSKQADDGIQRSVISYEPADEEGVEYTIQYLYSNVKIDGAYVPQMNYRFDTKITTEEGTTTNAVGDWGGEHEFQIDY
ncbi:MAG: tetratricopeptide repeat protein [Lachnospiraceae bacterium]|nr:tetratricopeptide repeat protein [Lachnospiraceae bacterium]